ncbi:MAG: CRTAC1 family protein, partial [Acidobacteria bacterium]|nr:CRTAC1 family protein [Acidobacteriota bacterium]
AFLLLIAGLAVAQLRRNLALPKFEDISRQAGLTGAHISSPNELYIMESTSGGVGFIDCNNDGKLDIVVAGGSTVERFRQGGDPMVRLYRQEPGLKFVDITAAAGLTRKGWGMGVAVADFDNDGWQDLYVTGYGGNVLYRNLGNCRFEDVTDRAGVRAGGFSTGAAWGDYDRDGRVDLFVPRYVHEDIDALPETNRSGAPCLYLSLRVLCGPDGLPGESDLLFHNRGDGTFEEVSGKAGVSDPNHYFGMQGVWADLQNDGWPDLYVSNDAGPNYLYRNKHDGTFEEVGLISGTALDSDGRMQASMGVDIADFAHEGRQSILITNFSQEGSNLFRNRGDGQYDQMAGEVGILEATLPYVGWGAAFVDLDNDGWPDIVIANGHAYPQMDRLKDAVPYSEPLLLFRNLQNGHFEDVSEISGVNHSKLHSRRGLAVGDVNNDGRPDLLLLNVGEPPTLLINRTQSANHSVMFRLVGTRSNRAAINTRITVNAGKLVQSSEIRGGSSYLSQNDLRLNFGVGQNATAESTKISWPSGQQEVYNNLPAGYIYTIVEGQGITDKAPLARTD